LEFYSKYNWINFFTIFNDFFQFVKTIKLNIKNDEVNLNLIDSKFQDKILKLEKEIDELKNREIIFAVNPHDYPHVNPHDYPHDSPIPSNYKFFKYKTNTEIFDFTIGNIILQIVLYFY
jgi:hypothetical protein